MRVYLDSSALIKRSVAEAESDALETAIGGHLDAEHVAASSSLAWIEVSRALRGRFDNGTGDEAIRLAIDAAVSGVAEHLITAEVIGLAKRIGPTRLRTLDAIHLATAVLLDADLVVAYDDRLLDACRKNGLAVATPGR
ncbi:MAG TPA: type II toxin-antitoxin system VapC family toxin [Acidimicrobiales bacterium]|nr:type II toxin-antitoxin system VapC family toxin [Acidimicrobiales bacterium]